MNAMRRDVGKIEIIELKTPTYKQSFETRDLSGLLHADIHTDR